MKAQTRFTKKIAPGLLLLLIAGFAWQCNPTKKVNGGQCSETGVVQDFTGLDGCKLLIVAENGEKLLPAEIEDPVFELEAGQRIRFSYQELTDQMSICMAEDKIVQITCIRLIDDRAAIPPCHQEDGVEKGSWLATLQAKHLPREIIRYPYKTNGWAYLFTGKEFYLYDCQGTLIKTGPSAGACLEGEVTQTEARVTIYPKK